MALSMETKNWIIGATGFCKASDAYLNAGANDPYFSFPTFYFNLSYLFELSLKGYLSFRGWDDRKIKKQLGHDLNKCWKQAKEAGYMPPSDLIEEMVEILAPLHKNHNLRYLPDDWLRVPEDHFLSMRVAHSHLMAVGSQLGIPENE